MAKSNLAKIIPLRPGIGGSAVPSEDVTKKIKEVSESAEKSDEKILKSNEKLSTNLEKLAKAISVGTIKPNEAPNYKDGGTWDQRSVADQAKDTFMGRKGADGKRDPFDKDSLKYKFGTIRGLAKTMNVVEDNSFVGNLLGRREDKLKRADTLMKMNPQMKNLKQFKGDDEKVRQYYIKQHEEQFAPAQAKAQAEKYKLDSMLQSGINPDELAKSVGGKRQIKAVETAQADELLKDKFRKQEVKSTLDGMAASVPGSMPSNVIPFPSPSSGGSGGGFGSDKESTLENNRLMAQQNEMLGGMRENTAAFPIYLEEWREETKRKVEYDAQLLQAVKEGGSGGGGGLMDLAGDMLGKGKGKLAGGLAKAGTLAKAAGGALMRNAGPLAAGAAVLSGGITAYQGYNEASDKVARGEITKEEGTVAKGGAIGEGGGQAVGGAVGALKGAALGAAVGSAVPVIGTAIGGLVGAAIGGLGGSYLGGKAGKFLGETGGKIKNWFSSSNPDKSGAEAKVQSMTATPQAQTEPKVTHATAAGKKIEEAKTRLEGQAQNGGQGTAAQQQGVREYDRVYQEARSDGKSVKEARELAAQARKKAETSAAGSGNAAGTPPTAAAGASTGSGSGKPPISSSKETKGMRIAGEPYIEGQPLSRGQMVAIQYGKGSGNSYPPAVEAQYAKQKKAEEQQQAKPVATAAEDKTKALASSAPAVASSDLDQRAEAARQNALADGASPAEAAAIAAKMKKYGSVVSAGQGRGDVIQPVVPPPPRTADTVASTSAANQAMKEAPAPNNVTSTNVSSTKVENRNTQAIKPPIRNQDSSFYNMVEARFVY